MGGVYFLLLYSLGLAITVRAQNCSRPVAGPNMDIKGSDILVGMFEEGATVSFACNSGYQSAGGSSVVTCTAGSWSSLRLRCIRKNCGPVGEVTNGEVDYSEGTEFGDKAVIMCDSGFVLVGKKEIYCQDKGWAGRLPSCEVVVCDPPPVIEGGSFSPIKEEYNYRDAVIYKCKNDYTLIGPKGITCSEDGTFKPDPPTCDLIQCEEPAVDNADWINRPPFRPSSTLTLQCRSGYSMKGERTQTCGINGKWSPGLPTCELIQCEEPAVDNADWINRSPYRLSSTLTFQCRSGYSMKGERTQTCGINGKWSPGLPTCEPKNCSRPVPGPNMHFKGNDTVQTFSHMTTVSFACDVGYVSVEVSGVIICNAGSWSTLTQKCQRKNCGAAVEITHGRVDYPEGTQFGDKAVITCDTGYKLVGKNEIICQDKGWAGRLPSCEVIQCEEPAVDNADWINRPPFRPSSILTFQCRSGYSMKGESTQTCGINGKWSPGLPTCEHTRNDWPLVVCFFGGFGSGVLLTLLVTSLMKKKGFWRTSNKDKMTENGELQTLK